MSWLLRIVIKLLTLILFALLLKNTTPWISLIKRSLTCIVNSNNSLLMSIENKFEELSTIQELCSCLVATNRNEIYFLINRLLRLITTLLVSTATTERSFSAIKIIKTKLRNKMGNEFLNNSMIVYIDREY